MTYAEAKLFIRNFKNYEKTFSKKTLEKCLEFEHVDYWTKKVNVDINDYRGQYNEYPKIQDKHFDYVSKEIHEKGLSATAYYRTQCYTFLIPDNYQIKEDKFFLNCIHTEMPGLKEFNFKCYHFDRLDTLIFLETDLQINRHNISLYIPINALLNKDVDTIIDRHTKYHKDYYDPLKAGRSWNQTKEQLQEWQNISLDVLNQPIVKALFKVLKNSDCKHEITREDLQMLMNGGIGAMRENIEKRQKEGSIIFSLTNNLQEKVEAEWKNFKKNFFELVVKDYTNAEKYNFEFYTKKNLYEFFCNQESSDLWELFESIQDGKNITKTEIMNFINLDHILENLYQFELEYDVEIHTDTYDNILFMIGDFISDFI